MDSRPRKCLNILKTHETRFWKIRCECVTTTICKFQGTGSMIYLISSQSVTPIFEVISITGLDQIDSNS